MVYISNGLRILATNLDALKSGKIVGAFSKTFLVLDKCFALYPDLRNQESETVNIKFWAECKSCESIDNTFPLSNLSRLTSLSIEDLETIFQQRANIFLISLRVYHLPNSIEVKTQSTGNFIPLPNAITIIDRLPILNDEQFREVHKQFQGLDLAIIPNKILITSVITNELLEINSNFLDESNTALQNTIISKSSSEQQEEIIYQKKSELDWIKTISTLGDRSIETGDKKSNVQAGTDFENIIKKSLEFIGFTVDHIHAGGSGGLDLFCSKPFPLIGECKSGKNIPGNTVYELDNLSDDHLDAQIIAEAQKLIIGAGKPTPQIQRRATKKNICIINPTSLQNLVELNARYPRSINLIELRPYFIAGQADHKVAEYIQKVEGRIRLRSHIVNLIKNHHEEKVGVEALFSAYPYSTPPQPIAKREDLHEILIELSSPLTGYLGKKKGNGWESDRFYFLRDLPI